MESTPTPPDSELRGWILEAAERDPSEFEARRLESLIEASPELAAEIAGAGDEAWTELLREHPVPAVDEDTWGRLREGMWAEIRGAENRTPTDSAPARNPWGSLLALAATLLFGFLFVFTVDPGGSRDPGPAGLRARISETPADMDSIVLESGDDVVMITFSG